MAQLGRPRSSSPLNSNGSVGVESRHQPKANPFRARLRTLSLAGIKSVLGLSRALALYAFRLTGPRCVCHERPRPGLGHSVGTGSAAGLFSPLCGVAEPHALFIEPDVFHAPAVENAIHHDGQPLDVGLLASAVAVVEDNWPGVVLGQFALYRP